VQREGESWVVEGDLLAARLGGGSEPCLISTGQDTSHTSPHCMADFYLSVIRIRMLYGIA